MQTLTSCGWQCLHICTRTYTHTHTPTSSTTYCVEGKRDEESQKNPEILKLSCLPHCLPNSLLLNVHVHELGIKLTCHPVNLHCSLFVSNPAAELISGKVSTGVLLFPLHSVKLAQRCECGFLRNVPKCVTVQWAKGRGQHILMRRRSSSLWCNEPLKTVLSLSGMRDAVFHF